MDWTIGANCYLLKAVYTYGKDWATVKAALELISKTFLKDEKQIEYSEKTCSLQYKYVIATIRQKYAHLSDLTEAKLLQLAMEYYTDLRKDQVKRLHFDLVKKINYRKRCRALGAPDIIGQTLKLEPLPTNDAEDNAIRAELIRQNCEEPELSSTITGHDGMWTPVTREWLANFFENKSIIDLHLIDIVQDVGIHG
ncbi:unnamed protein product, partial [Protopolystoma xenopodis]